MAVVKAQLPQGNATNLTTPAYMYLSGAGQA